MKIPAITGIIRRRILINYRVAPDAVSKILPEPFRPKLIAGYSIAGICLIRLEAIRPKGLPKLFGVSSENSAHRFAVVWKDGPKSREGVFVPRRDTDSRLNSLGGGRVFPGVHNRCKFTVSDQNGEISERVDIAGGDSPLVNIKVKETQEFPSSSIFKSLQESSDFFENGCIGYSSRPKSCALDGLMLQVGNWSVSPLTVEYVQSSYFDDQANFPRDSVEFDHALLMRNIDHEWHSEPSMTAGTKCR